MFFGLLLETEGSVYRYDFKPVHARQLKQLSVSIDGPDFSFQ
jgi:hypothetical protein